jgi:hypothetical protein
MLGIKINNSYTGLFDLWNVLQRLTVKSRQRTNVGVDELNTMHVEIALIAGSVLLLFPGNVFLK